MALSEGTVNLPSDGTRSFLGLWDGAAYYAPRADNSTAKNMRVALYDSAGAAYLTVGNPAFVDTELPSAVALSDSIANPTTPIVGAILMGWDSGATSHRRIEVSASADGQVGTRYRQHVTTYPQSYNGTTWDQQRGNVAGTLLAAAARTTTQTTATQTNHNARGVLVTLNVTAGTGGGLAVRLYAVDPISANITALTAAPTPVAAAGTATYLLYPVAYAAAPGGVTQATAGNLPRLWAAVVTVSDASSYTYSLAFDLLL